MWFECWVLLKKPVILEKTYYTNYCLKALNVLWHIRIVYRHISQKFILNSIWNVEYTFKEVSPQLASVQDGHTSRHLTGWNSVFFCGEECHVNFDRKHPNLWRDSFVFWASDRGKGKLTFKETILQIWWSPYYFVFGSVSLIWTTVFTLL